MPPRRKSQDSGGLPAFPAVGADSGSLVHRPGSSAGAAVGSYPQPNPLLSQAGHTPPQPPPQPQQHLQGQHPVEAAAAVASAAEAAAAEAAAAQQDEEERRREAAARRAEEESILAQAARIRESLAACKVAPCPEPKRGKTHRDCLLEEMVWLAKEFAKERAWKIKTAKRYAVAVQRSNLDLESRVLVRAREEERALRKRAAWIAKEVSAFWAKAQRVAAYKIRTEVEAKKKEVMDRQLDFLLGQTQKYSTMLAERLKGEEAAA